jgi:FtsH-binding integral membrane protein
MSQLSASAKLFGTTTLDERQAAVARKTYALLGLGVASAMVGGYLGSHSVEFLMLFRSPITWILALVVINIVPRLALWAADKRPAVALAMLSLDGFLSGLVLSPPLFYASYRSPGALPAALGVTLAMFVSVTGYMMVARQRFSAPVGLMTGITVSIFAAILLNMIFPVSGLGLLIAIAVGVLGVFMLVYATSDVLNNPDFDHPIAGALMLFAALFNIFVSVLNIFLRSRD